MMLTLNSQIEYSVSHVVPGKILEFHNIIEQIEYIHISSMAEHLRSLKKKEEIWIIRKTY